MSFDTSFIVSTSTRGAVDETLVALPNGDFAFDGFEAVGTTPNGEFTLTFLQDVRGLEAKGVDGDDVFVGSGEVDSPFHGSHAQRVALFDHIRSLLG